MKERPRSTVVMFVAQVRSVVPVKPPVEPLVSGSGLVRLSMIVAIYRCCMLRGWHPVAIDGMQLVPQTLKEIYSQDLPDESFNFIF